MVNKQLVTSVLTSEGVTSLSAVQLLNFEHVHGEKLWETDEDIYDYLVKVEPAQRAYKENRVKAIITGRRRSQRGEREALKILEIENGTGLVKLNPLAHWDFQRVWTYIRANEVSNE